MGRGKTDMNKIEDANGRQVTFSKRRAGLLKKASELSILCDAQVAVIIFSDTGNMFEFSNSSITQILARYTTSIELSQYSSAGHKPEPVQGPKEEDVLKKEIEKLKLKQLQRLGKDLNGLGLKELQDIEQELDEGLASIRKRKDQILTKQLEQARMQVTELHRLLRSTDSPAPSYIDYYPLEKGNMPVEESTLFSDAALDSGVENPDSDTSLRLGLSSALYDQKRKATEAPKAPESTTVGAQKRKRTCRSTNEGQMK